MQEGNVCSAAAVLLERTRAPGFPARAIDLAGQRF